MKAYISIIAVGLAGCAVIPDHVDLLAQHISHATQHAPFTQQPTDYGNDIVGIAAVWEPTRNLTLSASEGATLESCDRLLGQRECGGMWGPREVFQAIASYRLWSK